MPTPRLRQWPLFRRGVLGTRFREGLRIAFRCNVRGINDWNHMKTLYVVPGYTSAVLCLNASMESRAHCSAVILKAGGRPPPFSPSIPACSSNPASTGRDFGYDHTGPRKIEPQDFAGPVQEALRSDIGGGFGHQGEPCTRADIQDPALSAFHHGTNEAVREQCRRDHIDPDHPMHFFQSALS